MTKSEPVLRPATAGDVADFFGKPQAKTVQAVVMELDGRVIGIGGLAYEGDKLVAFGDFKPEALKYKRMVVKGARMVRDMVAKARAPVFTVADDKYPGSAKLLLRLGFDQVEPDGRQEVFKWPV